jgi:hypothetical protein
MASTLSAATRRRPAFATALIAKRRSGLAPQNDLLVATAWELGTRWAPWRIVVDPRSLAHEFDFTVCAGLSCLLLAKERTRMDEVARAIQPYAPARLVGVVIGARVCRVYIATPSYVMP